MLREASSLAVVAADKARGAVHDPTSTVAASVRKSLFAQHSDDLLGLFEAWDADGDGQVTREEFVEGVLALDISASREEALTTFDAFDDDRTGWLSMRELKIQADIMRGESCETEKVGAGAYEALSLVSKEVGRADCAQLTIETLLMIAALLIGPACVAFGLVHDATRSAEEPSVFVLDAAHYSKAIAHAMSTPLIATLLCLMFARNQTSRSGSGASACVRALCSWRSALIWASVVSAQSYCVALSLADITFEPAVHYFFRLSYALALLTGAMSALRVLDRAVFSFVTRDDEAFRTSQLQRTQLAMMKSFSRFGKAEHDGAYGFVKYERATDVLYQMWSVLRNIFRVAAGAFFLVFYLTAAGFAVNEEPEFEWHLVLFFILLLATAVLAAVGCSGQSVRNVLHIAISKPFFLGDIVHVHDATNPGGMGNSITGFVENFTFSHVVIRAFDCKQVWLAHEVFQTLTVSNWTRRPTKCVSMKLTLRPTEAPAAVKALVKFVKGWVDASADVKQSGYKKVALTSVDPGYTLTIIFFTAVGASKKKMRERLLLDIMEAARRLGLSLQPSELAAFLTGAVGTEAEPSKAAQEALAELLPKPKATKQEGTKKKDAAPPPSVEPTPGTTQLLKPAEADAEAAMRI